MSFKSSFVPLGQQLEDEEEQKNQTAQEMVVSLLNEAQLVTKDQKLECLARVHELIIHKDPSLLDGFFEEVTAFQQEKSSDVKKAIISFIEDACKTDAHLLTRGITRLHYMMKDDNSAVEKRVIVCFMQLYKLALLHLIKLKSSQDMTELWELLSTSKKEICDKLEAPNDGIRTLIIKFMQIIIVAQSKREQGSEPIKNNEVEVSLDMIPANHPVLVPSKLREESGMLLGRLLEVVTSPDVSSVNLMTCISTLCTIARQRPIHTTTVLQTFELLHANLPQHFSLSQTTSVTKHLKIQLLGLLRQPSTLDCREQLTTILVAIGTTQSEIMKNTPKPESGKRSRGDGEGGSQAKKQRLEDAPMSGNVVMEATEMTANELKPLLTPEAVVELVVAAMDNLPHHLPKSFRHSYTPIAAAGTDAQIHQVARLLASQMTAVGMGVGAETKVLSRAGGEVEDDSLKAGDEKESDENVDLSESMAQLSYLGNLLGLPDLSDPGFPLAYSMFFGKAPPTADVNVPATPTNLVAIKQEEKDEKPDKRKAPPQIGPPQKLRKIRLFDLSDAVRPLTPSEQLSVSLEALERLLDSEQRLTSHSGACQIRTTLIIHIVTEYGGDLAKAFLKYILDDLRLHFELAIAWLYAEYSSCDNHVMDRYDLCLVKLLKGTRQKLDSRDRLFTRLCLEAPAITDNALHIIKSYCREEERAFIGLSTLRDLVAKKPQGVVAFLEAILEVTMAELELARVQALHIAKKLYSRSDLIGSIEKFASKALQNLLSDHPCFEQSQDVDMVLEVATEWSEESVKMCTGLFLTLLPLNSKLLNELAIVYTSTMPLVKRILLKLLDQPVRAIGMGSPDLLEMVEKCPSGAEALVMRILYILTESAAPSPELVKRVRELYHRNSSDVRFLIPVLHGLQKNEVVAALPKFIRLSPNVTKGVFDRLLVSRGEGSVSPISPSELLIALHNIECKGDDVLTKAVIKATNLCFSEKAVYTQEILALVLQQLVEQNPLPMLLMRTVIQSLGVRPRLINFVMTILTRLISKQIWKQSKLWQGFVKCCEVTKPHSFQVALQLPPKQLENLLEASTIIRQPFLAHIQALTPTQKAVIPRSILNVLEKEILKEQGFDQEVKVKKRRDSSKRRHSKESSTDGDPVL